MLATDYLSVFAANMGKEKKADFFKWLCGKSSTHNKDGNSSSKDRVINGVPVGCFTYGIGSLPPHSWRGIKSIGRYCSFAKSCSVVGMNHPIEWVSTHPFLYNSKRRVIFRKVPLPADTLRRNQKTTIGNDVWIGEGAKIFRNVKLGHGCVVGTGSVVTKNVPPYAIVAGVPAKILRYRIPESLIPDMLEIAWWDWPIETIKARLDFFYDPTEFVKAFKRS